MSEEASNIFTKNLGKPITFDPPREKGHYMVIGGEAVKIEDQSVIDEMNNFKPLKRDQ